ncbi:HD domain-containing phosphohydrolase [Ferrovum sp.]|uniref:HD domain-containing phosphohydrolase n=1 Tax=Ferrovum sp. TaxID=2609467 RepID=UPI00260D8EAE|nr:HD domain-containing phosphohydrolase [Ferrovum sp.]
MAQDNNPVDTAASAVLILDDQATSRTILAQVVRSIGAEIQVREESSPSAALAWAATHAAGLVLVDYLMPGMNGIDFIRLLRQVPGYQHVPVIMITIKRDMETRHEALDAGVTDFLSKPVDMHECFARCRNLLTLRRQQLILEDRNLSLEHLVDQATAKIRCREKETLMRLARAAEYRDADTSRHLLRMSSYSRLLADAIGLPEEEAELIEFAAPLHDIGKIGIPDSILHKTGPLSDEEIAVMRQHPQIGHDILQDSPSKYLQMGGEVALAHHERYDGSGYPFGISGQAIPLSARIVAIADVFDALTTTRPYKSAWSIESSMQYLLKESGRHFDPLLVKVMLSLQTSVEKIHAEHSQSGS